MTGEQGEIDAIGRDSRAKRLRTAFVDGKFYFHLDGTGLIAYSLFLRCILHHRQGFPKAENRLFRKEHPP